MRDQSLERIKSAHALDGEPSKLADYYRQWAAAYDRDVRDEGYCAPELIVDCLTTVAGREDVALDLAAPDLKVIDVGCGTGLVGTVLAERGVDRIDGFDLSQEMVERAAATGAYDRLWGDVPLQEAPERVGTRRYDVALCCGVFTLGHVPPEALSPLLALLRPGGAAIVSTRKSYYEATRWDSAVADLQQRGEARLIDRLLDAPYIGEEPAHYWALEALDPASSRNA